jgi:predicted NUDIX family NTP pyrophosphohydrolase
MYRYENRELRVLLVHPGGPFWAKRDLGSWSIPKGEHGADEDALTAAIREFREETGAEAQGPFLPLGEIAQSKKTVNAWAFEGDFDVSALKSNMCEIEWPARSGRTMVIPEADRAEWFALPEARQKILPAQRPFLDRLEAMTLSGGSR